jgi:Repeat of Unknown Function (DUF347)
MREPAPTAQSQFCVTTDALAHSPQIEHSGTAEKSVKRKFPVEGNAKEKMPESSNKVPEITVAFWIIKIAATTLGETGGDSVTMTLNWGYLAGTALFLAALVLLVSSQIMAKKFHTFLYWATIIASTTFGTTMRILPIARWASATPAARQSCCSVCWPLLASGIGCLARFRSTPSARQGRRCFIGLPSLSPRPWELRWATGWPIPPALDTKVERLFLAPHWRSSRPLISGPTSRG